jgi:hypothetical protein
MCTAQKVKFSVQCNKTQFLQRLDEDRTPPDKFFEKYDLTAENPA